MTDHIQSWLKHTAKHRWRWLGGLGALALVALLLTRLPLGGGIARYGFYCLAVGTAVIALTVWQRSATGGLSRRLWSRLYFAGLALLVLGPLVDPHGYILALDTSWGPHYVFNQLDNPATVSRYAVSGAQFALHTLLGAELAQSVFILTILFLVGWGMYTTLPIKRQVAKYFAGTLYLLNPFVYDRLISGQWLLLLGYGLLPFAVRSLGRLLHEPTNRRALFVAVWWLVLTLCSFHFLFIFGLVFLVGWAIALLSASDKRHILKTWITVPAWYLLFNLFWLVPALFAASQADFVDRSHAFTFATHADIFGSAWTSAVWLQGFFGQKGVQLAIESWPVALLFLPIIGLAVYGAAQAVRHRPWRDLTVTLAASAYLAIILAVGVASAGSREIYLWLFDLVPGFTAMREPQKFVMLLAFFYAVFGAYGLVVLFDRWREVWQRVLLVGAAGALILLQVLPMLNGLNGQLHRTDYPIGWYRVRDITNETPEGKILVLPWQQYFRLPFAYQDKVIANPVPAMLERPTYVSRRIDVAGANEPPERPLDETALKIDWRKELTEKDIRTLQAYDVRWIVVLNSIKRVNAEQLLQFPQVRERYSDQEIMLLELDPAEEGKRRT